jgi:hypothetical protein
MDRNLTYILKKLATFLKPNVMVIYMHKLVHFEQGDQIGRIFAYWVTVQCGQFF